MSSFLYLAKNFFLREHLTFSLANVSFDSWNNWFVWFDWKEKIVCFSVPRKIQQPLLRHRRLSRFLASMQIILGVVVTSLSLWLLLWAPNLPVTDNPYWSGMPVRSTFMHTQCPYHRCILTVTLERISCTLTRFNSALHSVEPGREMRPIDNIFFHYAPLIYLFFFHN